MQIILASQSPRRIELLKKTGLKFSIVPSDFDEYFDESKSAQEVACELGLGKVLTVAREYPADIVIGGDLMISLNGTQIGKPVDRAAAIELLRNFSGKTHVLIASVAVACLDKKYQKVSSETSYITFRSFTEEFIQSYVDAEEVYDKAGGYSIQHRTIQPYIEKIQGRIDTVLGMPMNLVAQFLSDFNITISSVDLDQNSY